MGLFEPFFAERDARIAEHKAKIAEQNAKIKQINLLGALADAVAEQSAQNPTEGVAGPNSTPEKSPPPINSDLLQRVIQAQAASGDLSPILQMVTERYKTDTDPKRQIVNQLFGDRSPVNLQPGAAGGIPSQGGQNNDFAAMLKAAASGDADAMSHLAALDMVGMDANKYVGNLQASMRGYPGSWVDDKGNQYQAMFNALTHQPIPGTARRIDSKVQMQKVVGVDGQEYDIPTFGGAPVGQGGGASFPTKMPEIAVPIPMDDLASWRNAETLNSPPPGTTPKDAEKLGYHRVSTNAAASADALRSVKVAISEIESLMKDVFPKNESSLGRVPGGLGRKAGAALQTDPKAAQLESLLGGTLALYIRALGEKGTLAEGDVSRAKNLVPKLTDRSDVAWRKVGQLKQLFEKAQKELMGGSSSAKAPKRLPGESPAQYLKRVHGGG
jgi:hypothetical protein